MAPDVRTGSAAADLTVVTTPGTRSDSGRADHLTVEHHHDVVVIERGSFAQATCTPCGWSGPARRARAVADADASAHG